MAHTLYGKTLLILNDLAELQSAKLYLQDNFSVGKDPAIVISLDGYLDWSLVGGNLFERNKKFWANGKRRLTSNELAQIFASQVEQGYGDLLTIQLVLKVTDKLRETVRLHPESKIKVVPIPEEIDKEFRMMGISFHEFGHLTKNYVTFFARYHLLTNMENEPNQEITPTP